MLTRMMLVVLVCRIQIQLSVGSLERWRQLHAAAGNCGEVRMVEEVGVFSLDITDTSTTEVLLLLRLLAVALSGCTSATHSGGLDDDEK